MRAAVQPTFVRFVFEMPEGVGVNSTLSEQKLSLLFTAPLTFDLADAKLAAPPNISGITQKLDTERSSVDISLIGNVDVHSFREEKNYIVDIGFQQAEPQPGLPAAISRLMNGQGAAAAAAQVARAADPSREIAPPTSESIAQQMKSDARPEAKPEPKPEAKAEPKVEAKPDQVVEAKVEAKVEPKVESKPEPKPEVKAEAKVEPKPTAAPEPAKPVATAAPADVTPVTPKPEAVVPAVAEAVPPSPVASKEAAPAAPKAMPAPPVAAEPGIAVDIRRNADGLRLSFPFGQVPAALFRRADSVWLVFDSKKPLDLEPVRRQGGSNIAEITGVPLDGGQAVQIRMSRPQLASLSADAQGWALTFADMQQTTLQPLQAVRDLSDPARASVKVQLPGPGALHRLRDPEAGDTLMVVTAMPPARGFIKRQDFVEFSLLELLHGVVVQPNSDDVTAEIGADKVVLSRPGGLTLSSASLGGGGGASGGERGASRNRPVFDPNEWQKYQEGAFLEKQDALMMSDAKASGEGRIQPRFELARFYMARGLYAEAKGVLDLNLADKADDPMALIMRAVVQHHAAPPG